MHHRIITILLLVFGFQSSGLAQARGLIIYQDEWGADAAFPCVQEAADLSFDLCPQDNFTTTLSCFDLSYEVILINIGTNAINQTIVEQFANYLQLGGNLFFAHDVDIGTSHIDQSMSILMDAIGQETVTTMYQSITEPSTSGTLASIHDIECDTNYFVDFITGSTLEGPGLSESYAFSINVGVCLAFWHTGYGGILGIGTEYFSSGNIFDAGGDCVLGSGSLIWGFMDPEDPSCYTCKEPDTGCDDGDCLNGMEYWDENVCDCLKVMLEDPGCNDLDCANGIEILEWL